MYRFVAAAGSAALLGIASFVVGPFVGLQYSASAQFPQPTNQPPGNNDSIFDSAFAPSPSNLGNFTPQSQIVCNPQQFTSNFGPQSCGNNFGATGGFVAPGGFGTTSFGTTSFGTTPFSGQVNQNQFVPNSQFAPSPFGPSQFVPGGFSTGGFANTNTGAFTTNVPSTTPFANPPGFNTTGFGAGGFGQGGFNQGGFGQGGFNQGGFNQGGFSQGGFNTGGFNNGGFSNSNTGFISSGVAPTAPFANGGVAGGGFNVGHPGGHPNQFDLNRHPQGHAAHPGSQFGHPQGHAAHPGSQLAYPQGHVGHAGGSTGITLTSPNVVWEVQQSLATLAINPGPVDGIYGWQTRRGIKQYQRRVGYYPDGIISEGLLYYLRKDIKRYVSPAVDFRRITSIGPARRSYRPYSGGYDHGHRHGGHSGGHAPVPSPGY